MRSVVVRYQVKPDFVDQNAANIKAVMLELRGKDDKGVRYQSFQSKEDPTRFTHIGFYEDEAATERATALPAFQRFQTELKASGPVSPPQPEWLTLVAAGHDLF